MARRANPMLRDLNRVPARWRGPLRNYLTFGTIPRDPAVLALLAGEYLVAIMNDGKELADAARFIRRHLPVTAHGSPEAMAKWEHARRFADGDHSPHP